MSLRGESDSSHLAYGRRAMSCFRGGASLQRTRHRVNGRRWAPVSEVCLDIRFIVRRLVGTKNNDSSNPHTLRYVAMMSILTWRGLASDHEGW